MAKLTTVKIDVYPVDTELWIIHVNKIRKVSVENIYIGYSTGTTQKKHVNYTLRGNGGSYNKDSSQVFTTREALTASL